MNKHTILVFGELCSGKGTYCQRYVDQGYTHITTSDIVKQVSNEQSRSKLQQTSNLDYMISNALIKIIKSNELIVIDGIRQCSIVSSIISNVRDVSMIWLDVPKHIRKERFYNRARQSDNVFEAAEKGDNDLGLNDLKLTYKDKCDIIVSNY